MFQFHKIPNFWHKNSYSQNTRHYSKRPFFSHASSSRLQQKFTSRFSACHLTTEQLAMLIFSVLFQVPTGDLSTCKPIHACINWIVTPHLGKEFQIVCHALCWSVHANFDPLHWPSVLHAISIHMWSLGSGHLGKNYTQLLAFLLQKEYRIGCQDSSKHCSPLCHGYAMSINASTSSIART